MTPSRKKPGVAFWATVVVVVALLAYPLSMGPVEWALMHGVLPKSAENVLMHFYSPIAWLCQAMPNSIGKILDWYVALWE